MGAENPPPGHLTASNLQFAGLLRPDVSHGRLFLNDRRVVLFDVAAMTVLRQQLVGMLGEGLAMGVLSRFGYENGYRDADRLARAVTWQSDADWLAAGPTMHMLEGVVEVRTHGIEYDRDSGHFRMHGAWRHSYEVESHIEALGRSARPVCWTLTGYASGYASRFFGQELLAIETACVGKGDAECLWEIRPVAEWGVEAAPYLNALKAVDIRSQLLQAQAAHLRLRDVVMSVADWVWECDANGRYTYCSDQVTHLLGIRPEEMVGRPLVEFVPPDEAPRLETALAQAVTERVPIEGFEHRFTGRDGRAGILQLSAVAVVGTDGRVDALRGTAKDVTERVQAAEDLRVKASMLEAASDAILLVDRAGRLLYFNGALTHLTGYSRDELLVRHLHGIEPPEFASRIRSNIDRLIESGEAVFESVYSCKDGSLVPVEIHARAIEMSGQQLVIAIVRDMRERRKAQEALRESQARLAAIIDSEPHCVKLVAADGRLLMMNPAGLAMIEADAFDQVDQESVFSIVDAAYHEPYRRHLATVFAGRADSLDFEIIGLRGTRRWLSTHAVPLRDQGGTITALLGITRDITAQRALEEQLRQSQKMDAVGQLAGGLAHDFKNLLTAVLGYGQLMADRIPPGDPMAEELSEILQAAGRGVELTQSMLAFSRKQVGHPRPLDLNQLLRGLERMLQRIIREDIAIEARYQSEPAMVLADPGQLEQVVVNLVTNARDAMPRGGRITIETGTARVDEADADGRPGDFVVLALSDTGVGMDEKTRLRVFEPFFTTKPPGAGTGLGLATVYGIVQQHAGFVEVSSERDVGSEFRVFLPRYVGGEPDEAGLHAEEPVVGGTETILVVEDDDAIRQLVTRVLAMRGYRVVRAVDGVDALSRLHEWAGRVDLVLLDAIMPRMNGWEAAAEIRRVEPSARILFMSGYPEEVLAREGRLDTPADFVPKPIMPSVLLRKIRDVLDRTP